MMTVALSVLLHATAKSFFAIESASAPGPFGLIFFFFLSKKQKQERKKTSNQPSCNNESTAS
jgi:hypothetical protein